jgi:hypothetical protein
MYGNRSRPRPQKKKKEPRQLGRIGTSSPTAETPAPAEEPEAPGGYARYRDSRTLTPPREGEVTEVRAEPAPAAEAPAEAPAAEVPVPAPAEVSEELEALKTQNFNLRRENQALTNASNTWECPEGYSVDFMKISVPIQKSESGKVESPGNANLYRTVAKLERDGDVIWETEHLDRHQAIRACWLHALEEQKNTHEKALREKDKEHERRLEQQRATHASQLRGQQDDKSKDAKGKGTKGGKATG